MGTDVLGQFAHIGKSVSIKGEVSGSEDIYIDGQVEGSVQLGEGNLTVGPNGRVHANVMARNVAIGGSLDGNIQASERTELRKTAVVNGNVQTCRIAIEEGAFFKGKLEIVMASKVRPGSGAVAGAASTSTSVTASGCEPKK
jgi:cytoskeletal protein CcmA (bactofilin family)